MRPSTFAMWQALWHIDPWGQERADLQAAVVARAIAAGLLKKSGGGDWSYRDFMPLAQVDEAEKQRALSGRIRAFFNFLGNKAKR